MNYWDRNDAWQNIGWALARIRDNVEARYAEYQQLFREKHSHLSWTDIYCLSLLDASYAYYEKAVTEAREDLREYRRRYKMWRKYGDGGSHIMAAVNLLKQARKAGLVSSNVSLEVSDRNLWRQTVTPNVYLNRMVKRLKNNGWWPVIGEGRTMLCIPARFNATLTDKHVELICVEPLVKNTEWRRDWYGNSYMPTVEIPKLLRVEADRKPFALTRDVEHYMFAVVDGTANCNLGIATGLKMRGTIQRIFISKFYATGFELSIPF